MESDDPELARARSETRAALAARLAPGPVVTRASTMLRMARQGFRDMQETDHDRILLGFLGLVVVRLRDPWASAAAPAAAATSPSHRTLPARMILLGYKRA